MWHFGDSLYFLVKIFARQSRSEDLFEYSESDLWNECMLQVSDILFIVLDLTVIVIIPQSYRCYQWCYACLVKV